MTVRCTPDTRAEMAARLQSDGVLTDSGTEFETYGDRRREKRFALDARAVLTYSTGEAITATLVNASSLGVMLHSPVRPPLGVGARVRVEYLGIAFSGIVRHITPNRYGAMIGVQLEDKDERSRS